MLDIDLSEKAFWFAAGAHKKQMMNGFTEPYLFHVAGVAVNIIALCTDLSHFAYNAAVQMAYTHDILEDTPTTFGELRAGFGDYVATGTQALTKDRNLPKALAMEKSIQAIRAHGIPARYVKISDRAVNLSSIGIPAHWDLDRRRHYRDQGAMILKELQDDPKHPLAMLLQRRIDEYPVN